VPPDEVTVKLTRIPSPTADGFGVCPVIAVAVAAAFTVCATPAEVLPAKSASPAYGDQPKIGNPKVAGAAVEGEIVGEVKGDKLVVFKFRKRKRSRKKAGHRQHYTAVKITKVQG
jgi:hypothetical protein